MAVLTVYSGLCGIFMGGISEMMTGFWVFVWMVLADFISDSCTSASLGCPLRSLVPRCMMILSCSLAAFIRSSFWVAWASSDTLNIWFEIVRVAFSLFRWCFVRWIFESPMIMILGLSILGLGVSVLVVSWSNIACSRSLFMSSDSWSFFFSCSFSFLILVISWSFSWSLVLSLVICCS